MDWFIITVTILVVCLILSIITSKEKKDIWRSDYDTQKYELPKQLSDYHIVVQDGKRVKPIKYNTALFRHEVYNKPATNNRPIKATKEFVKKERSKMTRAFRKEIMIRDNYTCQICGKYMPDEVGLQVDHIVPVSKWGKSVPSNLQVLCSKCNGAKSNRIKKGKPIKTSTSRADLSNLEKQVDRVMALLDEMEQKGIMIQ